MTTEKVKVEPNRGRPCDECARRDQRQKGDNLRSWPERNVFQYGRFVYFTYTCKNCDWKWTWMNTRSQGYLHGKHFYPGLYFLQD